MNDLSPWAFRAHLRPGWPCVAVSLGYAAVSAGPAFAADRRQVRSFAGAWSSCCVALTWPVADLAAHWSLTALVVQRLLLTLAVPAAAPHGPARRPWSRPRPGPPRSTRWRDRPAGPPVAVVIGHGRRSWRPSPPGPSTPSRPRLSARGLLDLVLVAAGVVLWLPVLAPVPGTAGCRPLGPGRLPDRPVDRPELPRRRVDPRPPPPLSRRSPTPARSPGSHPLADQQVAGFLAKLGTIAVLWTVAFVDVNRTRATARRTSRPLTWARCGAPSPAGRAPAAEGTRQGSGRRPSEGAREQPLRQSAALAGMTKSARPPDVSGRA